MNDRRLITDCITSDENRNVNFLCYGNDCISNSLFLFKQWENDLMSIAEKYLKDDSVIFDVGANIGTWSIGLAKGNRKIYSFEPLYTSFLALCGNVFINKLENSINVFNYALTDDVTQKYTMKYDTGNVGYCMLQNTDESTVSLLTLDSLKLNKLDFMKVDVEGHEINVLKGGTDTIQKFRPVIMFECWNHESFTEKKQLLFEYITNVLNYNITHIRENDYIALPN